MISSVLYTKIDFDVPQNNEPTLPKSDLNVIKKAINPK